MNILTKSFEPSKNHVVKVKNLSDKEWCEIIQRGWELVCVEQINDDQVCTFKIA
ncbi:MAG: hypothetical protein K6C97_10885 [Treponema sp.]|nr:hypothetical protein [Treponema sp.]